MFGFVSCQSPVFFLLRRAPQFLVEGVGQEGEDSEGREGVTDDLKDRETTELAG